MMVNQDIVKYRQAEKSFLKQDYHQAAQQMASSITAGGADSAKLNLLGDIYMALEKYDRALLAYADLSSMVPEDLNVLIKLADAYSLAGQTDMALEFMAKVLEQRPEFRTALLWKARILSRDQRFSQAIDLYYQALGD